jgi:membrane-associated protease RseP (regulator of RpoE activity)
MLATIGVLAFIFALLLSVMLHELGHFLFAKRFGMKVTEFFLGFGKRLWSFTKGETEFGIKAIPAGGYCRIVGMSAREELAVEDSDRAFYKASVGKRLVVLGAGSALHFIFGFVLLFTLFAVVGTAAVTPKVESVAACYTTINGKCPSSTPILPAKTAGILAGDEIVAINGKSVTNWSKDVLAIRNNPGTPVVLTILRAGSKINFTITPQPQVVAGKTVGIIGVINALGMRRQNPYDSTIHAWQLGRDLFTSSITSLGSLPGKIPSLLSETFGGKKRDPQGLVGVVGVAQASAQTVSDSKLAWNERIATFIMIIASLNIFVGIFNLLPLLPLDGGHMAIAIADGARNIWARIRRRQTPRPIDVETLTPITIVVFIFLAALSILLLAADIFNPVHFNL